MNEINSLSNTVLITASSTFLAAALAQIISHQLTKRREYQNNIREIYQSLYSEILLDIYFYFEIKTHFRRYHDVREGVNEEEIFDKIQKHVRGNLKYAGPDVIFQLEAYASHEYFEDGKGNENESKYLLIHALLNELITHQKNTKMLNRASLKKLKLYRLYYLMLSFINSTLVDEQMTIMRSRFMFRNQKVLMLIYPLIKVVNNRLKRGIRLRFLKFLLLLIFSKKDRELQGIDQIFKEINHLLYRFHKLF
ncbi:hypothetical protein [Bacillus suaedae]|uniref:Uncharacterized protein n=1 Tax=Halalkalibacter suaedae TaxID=2822140 RepID=A0A941ANG9_9BACI|nr:hypothetical protein [Bacillus suaedae]MBP3950322.1 hypothetical protein [Bacillus suaedae]